MNKYWFTLYADTFLWLKSDIGLAYQSKSKTSFLFPLSRKIDRICQQLLDTKNLYTVELTNEDINNREIDQWINSLVNNQAGYMSHNVEFKKRPVSLKPILKVQDKKEHYKWQHIQGVGGEILQNLHEITFYINGSEHGSDEYFRQTFFPLKECQFLCASKILSFIRNSQNPFLTNINLVGNVFLYPDFKNLINKISDFSIRSTIHIVIQDFIDNMQLIKESNWQSNIHFNILVDSVFDYSLLQNISLPFSITVFVLSEEDYNKFDVLSKYLNMQFLPLYNKMNLSFFESNVFTQKDELYNIDLSKKDIFMRQALNIIDFGKLNVMPDGCVYANVNTPSLGNIDDLPYSLVYKEFTEGKSWFQIRDEMPCKDCIYQWLCPSPSNYEIAIGRPNLCHVKH